MDAETLKIAQSLGMNQKTCATCGELTLFVVNKYHDNTPRTCGRMSCGVKAGERWAGPCGGLSWA